MRGRCVLLTYSCGLLSIIPVALWSNDDGMIMTMITTARHSQAAIAFDNEKRNVIFIPIVFD